jgi:hypothetical protein
MLSRAESLTVQPNTTYAVEHDNQRLSSSSISIKKSYPVAAPPYCWQSLEHGLCHTVVK